MIPRLSGRVFQIVGSRLTFQPRMHTLHSIGSGSWFGFGNQEAAQEDAQAQAQEDAQEDPLAATGARLSIRR
jgi:hypothetical protein